MATTRMTATNTFSKGLIMDFNPMVTKTDCLVNALNATLLTYNGNELQLQQDMGNGRVETAYLPEGYVPVGSCEFGDIIYIVSYNPLENKSQIGCFPSPERNITSDEITDMQQNLTNADFQKMSSDGPTGVLNATSVKKIIYGNKNMNPGDKYIIYEEGNEDKLKQCGSTLSDYGNTSHSHNTWPKLVKLSVVSIEDSGKIVDLNASVKWYDNDYYIAHLENGPTGASVDIDSYRSLVSSAYAVFQSKVSGKLAILAELEAIDEFSCTYDVYTEKYNEEDSENTVSKGYTRYKIYFYTAWGNEHNDVNPSGFLFTKSEWTKDSGGGQIWVPTLQENGDYMYKPGESTEDFPEVPVKAASTIDESTKLVTSYDATAVYGYTRLYDLGNPTASDYQDFIENKSYNALISDIIDWKLEGGTHTAITSDTDYDNLRQVTQVTRILNQDTGEPVGSDIGEFQYVYNLDIYSYDSEREQYVYQTKGLNGDLIELVQIGLTDDVINNYFHKDIPTLITSRTTEDVYDLKTSTFIDIEVPVDETTETVTAEVSNDLSHLIWNYEIAPVMPYGVLDWLAISGNIDFSKLGTGLIDLAAWRYYNSGNVSTLTWGLEAYPEPNKGIAEVVFDFYDNQGLAASYHITGKTSYSGTFTENIVLGQRNSSYKMNNVDAYEHVYFHAGAIDDSETESEDAIYLTEGNKPTKDPNANLYSSDKYLDDSGTLYPNILYLVRITVKYCPKDVVGNYNTDNQISFKTFYRWYWTNGLLNESYYSVQDFDALQPSLSLDFSASFDTRGNDKINQLIPKQYDYYSGTYQTDEESSGVLLYSTLGARIYAINQDSNDDATGNIKMSIEPGLAEGFNTFNLNEAALVSIDPVYVRIGHSSITKSIEAPSLIHGGDDIITDCDDNLQPIGDFNESLQCSHESNGWDRTGYASYNYGVYQNIVSDNLLSILDTERVTYNGIDPVGQATGSTDTDLYDSKEAYTAYTDSFCLNIVGGRLGEKGEDNDFSYYDSAGNLINDLEHWQEITCELKTIRDQGIPLTLTGITFSKIFAAESTPDSGSVVLRSMIHNLSNPVVNGPDIVGLHFYNEHLYFNEMIMWYMGERGGMDTKVGTVYSRNLTKDEWVVDPNNSEDVGKITTYNKKHNKWRPNYADDQPQELLSGVLSQPISAFMIGATSKDSNFNYTNSNMAWDYIHTEFGLTDAVKGNSRIHQNKKNVPYDGMDNFMEQTTAWGIHSFAVRDVEQNLVIPFADYFVSGNGTANKQYSCNSNNTPYSLGDMLGSIFAQTYVVTGEDTNNYLLEDITYLQDYTEYWNTDIVVKIDTDNLADSTISNLITVQTQPLDIYLACLFENAPCIGDPEEALQFDTVNLNNVTLRLYGIQRTIAFQYNVPYNLGNLVYTYNQMSVSSNKIYLSTSTDDPENYNGNQEVQSFTGNVTANTLYTWTGSTVVQLGQGSTIYLANKFIDKKDELCLTYTKDSSNLVSSSGLGDLAKILHYDNGTIEWRNLSQCSYYDYTYNIKYQTDDDDPHLEGLPRITLFRKYNPGK